MPTIGAGDDPAVSVVAPASTTSFDDFYRQQGRAVVGLAYSLTADWALAEEIAQDAFVQAYVRWRRVQDHPRPDLWIRRVAVNRATSHFRRRSAERRATGRTQSRADADARSRVDPHDGGDDWLLDHIRRLPRQQAQAVVLVHVEQLSHDEAATVMGCAASTLRTHLLRGRQAVQRAIEDEEAGHGR
jgi:RNA polymerase sigma-70 factor (ECF subfamily)